MSLAPQPEASLYRHQVVAAASRLGLLESGSNSAAQLLGTLCDACADIGRIAGVIEQNPVLCVRVLRVANSAYYGQQRRITTISRAVQILGIDAIRCIAAAVCINHAASRRAHKHLPDITALLLHSLATAIAAEKLARQSECAFAGDAFIAGVLHHLGIVVLASVDNSALNKTGPAIRLDAPSLDHQDCVALILEEWKLPASLVAAAGNHHKPLEAPAEHRKLTSIVSLAATLALASGYTFSLDPVATEHDGAAAELLGLSSTELEVIRQSLPASVHELQSAFGR
jgi:HD-like signal output (HDOD) protein